jgi:signal transduction histidine kinase
LVKTDLAILQIENVSLNQLSQEVFSRLEGFAESRNVVIKMGKGIADIAVKTDATHMKTIVENLVSNAIKYSDDEGDDSFVQLDAYIGSNGSVNITIGDNGVGIPEKYQAQVFGMFKQFHPERANGTGLGLYIVQKGVEKLNGSITFESSTDGTSFNINLPIIHS